MFKPVESKLDVPALEREVIARWRERDTMARYLVRNEASDRRFSFLDGPITANNPMGVHHAWGRTYKDLFQRYHAMLGQQAALPERLRLPGPLGRGRGREGARASRASATSRRSASPSSSSAARSASRRFAGIQTEQSNRLGYWMDWDNSYFTMSDENNYTIWHFLKDAIGKGWLYKGHDVMPWCPRCGTGISEHGDRHRGLPGASPTYSASSCALPADEPGARERGPAGLDDDALDPGRNVAAAVHPELTYVRVRTGRAAVRPWHQEAPDSASRGEYDGDRRGQAAPSSSGAPTSGPFDELPAARPASSTGSSPGTTSATTRAPASSTSRLAAVRKTSALQGQRPGGHRPDRRVRHLTSIGWQAGRFPSGTYVREDVAR